MSIFVDCKNIESDNLIMSLYMGTNLKHMYEIYDNYDLKIEKELDKLFKFISESNKLDRVMMDKLFKEFTMKEWRVDIFHFAVNWKELSFGKSFEEFLYSLGHLDENEILKRIYSKLKRNQEDSKFSPKEKVQINDILEILMSAEVDAEFKWNLIEVCYDIKSFLYKCSQFLKDSRKILEKKLIPFNERGNSWGEKLKDKIEKEGIAFAKKVFEDLNEDGYDNIFISPRIMDNYAFDIADALNSKDIYMWCGERFEVLNEIFGKENERQWVQNVLKYLSDESRFKIMSLLKEKPMYSSELGKSLGISNATISHHTTLLFLAKLIEETKINNKCYMKLRDESINEFVEVFKKEFNLEEGENA